MVFNAPQMDEQQIFSVINKLKEFVDDDAKAILSQHIYNLNAEYGSHAVSSFVTRFFKELNAA